MRCRFVLIVVAMHALVGCASMPLSTMWKLRGFGPQDLLRIEPSQLRVAAATEEGICPNAGETTLTVQLVGSDGAKRSLVFTLQDATGDVAPDRAREWTIARPTAASERRLADLRDDLRANPDAVPEAASIHVEVAMRERPAPGVHTLHLHVAVRLAAGDPWLTLFDGLPLPVDAQ